MKNLRFHTTINMVNMEVAALELQNVLTQTLCLMTRRRMITHYCIPKFLETCWFKTISQCRLPISTLKI